MDCSINYGCVVLNDNFVHEKRRLIYHAGKNDRIILYKEIVHHG